MKNLLCLSSLILVFSLFTTDISAKEMHMSPELALENLEKGNQRYVNDQLEHPRRDLERRESLQSSQAPFATVLTCSDSRVSPEVIFDQGLGDIFVVRVAGNVAGQIEQESIEYSAVYLGSSLIFVLGHENCGAVKAVLANKTEDIESIAKLIQPALAQTNLQGNDATVAAIKANVLNVVKQLQNNPVIAKLIQDKKINVVGGYYNLTSGKVELLTK